MRRQVLIGDAHVDVTEIDDVAEILRRAIVLRHGALPGAFVARSHELNRIRTKVSTGHQSRFILPKCLLM